MYFWTTQALLSRANALEVSSQNTSIDDHNQDCGDKKNTYVVQKYLLSLNLNISQPLLNKLLQQINFISIRSLQNENQSEKKEGRKRRCLTCIEGMFLNKNSIKSTWERWVCEWTYSLGKGEELAKKCGKTDLMASEGWFHKWKKRENIYFKNYMNR